MLQKTLGVTLIVVLGGIWFALQEFGVPDDGGPQGPVPIATARDEASPSLGARAPRLAGGPSAPANAPMNAPEHVTGAPRTQAPRLAAEAPRPAAPDPAPTPRAATGSEVSSPGGSEGYQGAMSNAARLHASGDAAGAEAAFRQAMAQAGNSREMAQAGLQLAALTRDRLEKRQLLSVALHEGAVRGADFEAVGQMLRELNASPNTSLIPLLQVERHSVASGDNLWTLVNKGFPKRYGVTLEVGLVKLVNGMRSDTLRAGQTLLVPIGELSIVVESREHGLVAWLGDVAIAAYRVGLGKDDRTPIGQFVIRVKQEDPTWFFDGKVIPHGDPENILGTRWLGFEDQPGVMGFGIHGTTKPESVGYSESMGCVRMRNGEVEELFEYVARGTRVTIR